VHQIVRRSLVGPVVAVGLLTFGWGAELTILGSPIAKQGTGVPDAGDNRHPSGRDRSVEAGGSGTQGNSPSDPDGDSNGGPDKPGKPGGVDLDDQDGNNGCGNDDDFEDDNNGNCGGNKPTYPSPRAPKLHPGR
jgi:hypothetical protein